METRLCALCEVDDADLYKEENGYRAVRCRQCGLVYTSPRPTIAEMKALYQGQETKIDLYAHIADRDRKTVHARAGLRVIERYKRGGRLLEVGSAAGYFLHAAKERGFDVQGLDITPQFADFSRTVLGVPTHEGTLEDAPFEPGSFDVVYMRNVLSHLAYPVEELATLRRLLAPSGVLVMETGNVAELPAARAGELELPDHLYHFSEETIRRLLDKTGFETLAVRRYGLLDRHPLIGWVGGLFKRRRPARPQGDAPADPAPADAGRALRPLPTELPPARWTRRAEAGLSTFIRYRVGTVVKKRGRRCTLIAVAQRPA